MARLAPGLFLPAPGTGRGEWTTPSQGSVEAQPSEGRRLSKLNVVLFTSFEDLLGVTRMGAPDAALEPATSGLCPLDARRGEVV